MYGAAVKEYCYVRTRYTTRPHTTVFLFLGGGCQRILLRRSYGTCSHSLFLFCFAGECCRRNLLRTDAPCLHSRLFLFSVNTHPARRLFAGISGGALSGIRVHHSHCHCRRKGEAGNYGKLLRQCCENFLSQKNFFHASMCVLTSSAEHLDNISCRYCFDRGRRCGLSRAFFRAFNLVAPRYLFSSVKGRMDAAC